MTVSLQRVSCLQLLFAPIIFRLATAVAFQLLICVECALASLMLALGEA